jgi:hypothetical protein
MSIFKKMAEMGQKFVLGGGDTTRERAKFTNELCEHLRQLGVNATAVDPRTVEGVDESWPFGLAKVEDRNINFVMMNPGLSDDRTRSFYCTYHTRANVEGLEKTLDVEGEPKKKGFLSREVVDYQWKGGDLAQRLNADADLKNMLITAQAGKISVKPNVLGFTSFHGTAVIRQGNESWGGSWKKKSFPTREAFEVYDRIAHHILSIIGSQS